MPQNPLEFSVLTFTVDWLEVKVKNISSNALDRRLTIKLYAPRYLVSKKVNEAANAAADNPKPIGVASLDKVVTCPEHWSVWAALETSNTSVIILLFNDCNQAGDDFSPPIELAAGAEFIIRIPLDPQANRDAVNLLYSYKHGTSERVDGKLELKSTDTSDWTPNVTLTTDQASPTMIKAGELVKIFWEVKDGVSATLRGPLPGGNSELTLSPDPQALFKISAGSLEIRVVSAMTYILQAEVKRPDNKPNVQVVRMLSLDTDNKKHTYMTPRPSRVLPYGLIEIDWAAWGVRYVQITVSAHSTYKICLTQQTLGRFYEGSGVLRINATKEINGVKTRSEAISILAPGEDTKTNEVQVIPWIGMGKANLEGALLGLAVSAPRIAALTSQGLYIANVGDRDTTPPLAKLAFSLKSSAIRLAWIALTAVDQRFVCLGKNPVTADFDIVPFTKDGNSDQIPPLTLPPELKLVAVSSNPVFDFVGFSGRTYFVIEGPGTVGPLRYAYSVGFNNNKADLREEPMLARLNGYRLISFDHALYALNRQSGQMLRFDLDKEGKLGQPQKAASAVKKSGGAQQSMIADGLLVPVGRLLVVLSPTAVPSAESLLQYGLQNTLRYESTSSLSDDIPQDLIYNPQKDYWGRCGHDLEIKPKAVAAFRGGESMRLWVIQQDCDVQTLAVGEEPLFAPDFVFKFPTKPLPPYLNKKRQFKITNMTGRRLVTMRETYQKIGLTDFSSDGLAEQLTPRQPIWLTGLPERFEFKYNEADPGLITLRFLVERGDGVKYDYFLELTFSGPDLSTATLVFKRIAISPTNEVSIAEIPGTSVQYSTSDPLVLTLPKLLIEGVKLLAHNATTYQLWREAPEAKISNPYNGEEIKITYDTPAFYLFAYGAGQLQIDVDFGLPADIEVSSGSQPQRKMIRINTDKSTGLHAENLSTTSPTSFQCKISYLRKQELNAMYVGDGVASESGEAIYLPVGDPRAWGSTKQIFKINPEDLSVIKIKDNLDMDFTRPRGVFSPPNSIVLSNEYVFAVFTHPKIHVLDYSLERVDMVDFKEYYFYVTGIKCHYESNYVLVGTDILGTHYTLSRKFISKNTTNPGKITFGTIADISLDNVKGFREQNRAPRSPAWVSAKTVSPIAISPVSPGGVREVAVCIDGGLFVIGSSDKDIRTLALESAFREEDIVFGSDGKHIYCLHSESDDMGLRLSRVDNQTWKQMDSLSLRSGEKAADLATNTRPIRDNIYKNHRSISMVPRDDKLLFVSHGRFIFKVDMAAMKLLDTYKTELPCRVFHVSFGKPTESSDPRYGTPTACTLLYAMGASFTGQDDREPKGFKTHLYKIGILDK